MCVNTSRGYHVLFASNMKTKAYVRKQVTWLSRVICIVREQQEVHFPVEKIFFKSKI